MIIAPALLSVFNSLVFKKLIMKKANLFYFIPSWKLRADLWKVSKYKIMNLVEELVRTTRRTLFLPFSLRNSYTRTYRSLFEGKIRVYPLTVYCFFATLCRYYRRIGIFTFLFLADSKRCLPLMLFGRQVQLWKQTKIFFNIIAFGLSPVR